MCTCVRIDKDENELNNGTQMKMNTSKDGDRENENQHGWKYQVCFKIVNGQEKCEEHVFRCEAEGQQGTRLRSRVRQRQKRASSE